MSESQPVYLCGPTASGKSSLAVALAEELGGEIINGDAFQLYKGVPIITAAPGHDEKSKVPHHLYEILEPSEQIDAMRYRELAKEMIAEVQSRGAVPIVVGGSGLYLKFLTHGPSPLPQGDEALREKLDSRSLDSLVEELRSLDPVEAERTDLKNRRYVTRALEICLLSKRPCSELRDRWESRSKEVENQLTGIFIQRERDDLHKRIKQRTDIMLSSGAIDEVASLDDASEGLLQAIGIPQISDHLSGEIDMETCRERIEAATRQYAKRQETWFRRESWLKAVQWFADDLPPVRAAIKVVCMKF